MSRQVSQGALVLVVATLLTACTSSDPGPNPTGVPAFVPTNVLSPTPTLAGRG